MRTIAIFAALILVTTVAEAKTWIGLDAGYQQTSKDSSLSEVDDKTGYFGSLVISHTFWIIDKAYAFEPSLSYYVSSLTGSTSCCGQGTIDTQAVLAELPLLYHFGATGVRLRPGVMFGDDLNFNILPAEKKSEVRFAIGLDAFRKTEWFAREVRYGAKISSLPSDSASLMAGLFIQVGFGANPVEPIPEAPEESVPTSEPTPAPIIEPAPTPAPVEKSLSSHSVEVVGNDVKVTLPKDRVRFAVGQSTMNAEDQAFVDRLAKAFIRVASQYDSLLIVGHSDKTGRVGPNLKLSKDRAEAVARLFRKTGIKRKPIKVEGRGSKEPLKEGDSEEAYVWNRRVEVFAVKVKDKEVVVRELTEGVEK